jgi:hypothetical protein
MADQVKGAVEAKGADSDRPEGSGSNRRVSETAYPYWGLSQAIEMVQAVRRAGGKEAQSDAVMKEMGIAAKTDRRWTYGVPSAKLFGLVERVGRGDSGKLRITDMALRITNPVTPEAGRVAKIAALKTPELYVKLLEQFAGHPVPTSEGLKNLLFTEYGIVESMAMMAAEAFIDSVKAADLVTPLGLIVLDGAVTVATADTNKKPEAKGDTPVAPPGMKQLLVPNDFVIYKCKISGGRVIDIPLPPQFSQGDVNRLHAFLLTQVDEDPAANEKGAAQ